MKLLQGDCREVLRTLADNSVDAVVCDPPYELGFMGKKWDSTGIAYDVTVWQECLRVLKPGGRLLAFGGTRTYHRLACAIEDAGFAIADQLQWLYGSGFPKSLDISKAIDKAAGAEREQVMFSAEEIRNPKSIGNGHGVEGGDRPWMKAALERGYHEKDGPTPATPEALQWDGWGTALKPMHEPVCFAIKPLEGTYAANVLKWGCGGLNIDGCRIGTDGRPLREPGQQSGFADVGVSAGSKAIGETTLGRWPGNVLLDPEAAAMLDEQSGELTSGKRSGQNKTHSLDGHIYQCFAYTGGPCDASRGGASRFFYCAKVARWERSFGCEMLDSVQRVCYNETIPLTQEENGLWENTGLSLSTLAASDTPQRRAIIVSIFGTLPPKVADLCSLMCLSGRKPKGLFQRVLACTISTATDKTTASKISNWLRLWSTSDSIAAVSGEAKIGTSRVASVETSSELIPPTGISAEKDGPSITDASPAILQESWLTSELARLEDACKRIPSHETVKPVSLLRWLCRLVTPPSGTVLDPFMGSGSCGIAAKLEGFDYIGIELEPEYHAIAEARIAAWQVGSKQDAKTKPDRAEPKPETQMPLPLE